MRIRRLVYFVKSFYSIGCYFGNDHSEIKSFSDTMGEKILDETHSQYVDFLKTQFIDACIINLEISYSMFKLYCHYVEILEKTKDIQNDPNWFHKINHYLKSFQKKY